VSGETSGADEVSGSAHIDPDGNAVQFGGVNIPDKLTPTACEGESLREAIQRMGGQERVASLFNVSQQAVSQWAVRGYAPVQKAKAMSDVSGVDWRALVHPDLRDLLEG